MRHFLHFEGIGDIDAAPFDTGATMVVFLPAHFVPGDGAEAGEDQKAHVQAGLEISRQCRWRGEAI